MKEKAPHNFYGITSSANVRWTFEKLEGRGNRESKSVVKYCYTIRFENSFLRNDTNRSKDEE